MDWFLDVSERTELGLSQKELINMILLEELGVSEIKFVYLYDVKVLELFRS